MNKGMHIMKKTEIEHIAKQVLRHLYEAPYQKDTLTGICQWSLFEGRVHYSISTINTTITLLMSKQMITEKKATGPDKVYQIKKSRKSEVSDVLNLK
jgi:hypothetical protein